MPAVSVCLPVFNGERYLASALESLRSQSFRDFEVVIIDDCSTDRSLSIAKEYSAQDGRLQVVQNDQNKGLFANYNACFRLASAPLIKPFAQDDVWHPNALSVFVEAFRHNPTISLAACRREWIADEEQTLNQPVSLNLRGIACGADVVSQCLTNVANLIGEPSSVMLTARALGDGFNTGYYHLGDLDLWLRILKSGDFYQIDETLCKFRRHSASTTNKNLEGLLFAIDLIRLANENVDSLKAIGYDNQSYKMRIVESLAWFMTSDEAQVLSVEKLLTQENHGRTREQLDSFKELTFYALKYAGQNARQQSTHVCGPAAQREGLLQKAIRAITPTPN